VKEEDYQRLFEFGKEYLLGFEEVTEEILNHHLYIDKLDTIEKVFKRLLQSLKNRGAMNNTIGKLDELENFEQVLCGYKPKKVMKNYDGWRELFKRIKAECKPKGRMDIDNKQSYWVIFCKGAIDGAKYMSRFQNYGEFAKYVDKFYSNELTREVLPMRIGEEIRGIKFALACDFLKECGYSKYVKPDRHLTYIFNKLGICDSENDHKVYDAIINFANVIGEEPYTVDKLFWLIGSGNFYKDLKKKVKTNKKTFVEEAKRLFNVD